jgi:hypothetical protein
MNHQNQPVLGTRKISVLGKCTTRMKICTAWILSLGLPLGPCTQRSCIGGRKLLILGVADVRLHLLVRIAGHAMGCSRPMNATAPHRTACVHTVRPSAAADSRVLNTPKTICFSHLVALRSAARTRLHTDMVDYGRPEVLLSTLLVLNLRRLTATSGYQVRARCRPSGWAPDLHWSVL